MIADKFSYLRRRPRLLYHGCMYNLYNVGRISTVSYNPILNSLCVSYSHRHDKPKKLTFSFSCNKIKRKIKNSTAATMKSPGLQAIEKSTIKIFCEVLVSTAGGAVG